MGLTVKGSVTSECIVDAGLQPPREKTPRRTLLFPQDRASLAPQILQMLECKAAMAASLLL